MQPTGGSAAPHPSDLTARFAALVGPDVDPVRLDEVCTVVAAHFLVGPDGDGTDLAAVRAGLDVLAAGVTGPGLTGVVEHLIEVGIRGEASDYGSSASSLLPEVLRRRRGLPILLAVVAVEVGRRVGVEARVVGMPGHVLVVDGADPERMADPFNQRTALAPSDARDLFVRLHGPAARWDERHLDPIGSRAVVVRILANLANRFRSDARHQSEATALGLRCLVPGVSQAERGALASALARSGAFDRAADEVEALADAGGAGTDPEVLRTRATRWRARLN